MYVPEYFQPYELVPEDVYNQFDDDDGQLSLNFWNLFDARMLVTADRLRRRYGKMVVNTWWWGGGTQYRGFRPPGIDVGAKWSQHRFGRGLDCVIVDHDVDDVVNQILNNPFIETFEFITAIELDVQWLHFDTRNWDKQKNGIFTFTQ